MADVRHLSNAPIKEALIACHFSAEWTREFADVCGELAGKDGRASDLLETNLHINIDARAEPQLNPATNSRIGKRIDFPDRKQVLQIQRNSFTFSQLEPYRSWDEMLSDAYAAWKTLRTALENVVISRLTVRYINAIDLPIPGLDFNDYLTASPVIPSELPQGISQFLIRTVSPIDKDVVVVTQSLSEVVADKVRIVVDIDTSCADPAQLVDETLLDTLSRLRDRKNGVFFSYLTEKALEIYK